MEDVTVPIGDSGALPATLFVRNTGLRGTGPLVLLSSATAVSRRFHRRFAQYLADSGAHAVMTYDYRGLNGELSRREAMNIRMADWALVDFPAAVAFLRNRYPDVPLAGLGHSFGGQAFGLSGTSDSFTRYMTLAAGSGYLGHMRDNRRLHIAMNWYLRPLAAVIGHVPRWAGLGEAIPYGAFNQWRRWCRDPDYFMGDESLPEKRRFADVLTPMMAVGFTDDPWATPRNVEALVGWYGRAQIRRHMISPEEAGGPIGHMGFFRRDHEDVLWPQIADWLVRH